MKAQIALVLILVTDYGLSQNQHPETISIAARASATLRVPGFVDFLVADGNAVWVTNRNRIEKLERDQPQPVATVEMPKPGGGMALGFGAVWVASCQDASLYRIDRQAARVAAIIRTGLADPTGELSVDVGDGSVWIITDKAGVLSRISPETNEVIARILVAPNSYALAYGFDAVWITNTEDAGSVQRVDPRTNRVVGKISVGPTPRFLAVGEGGVWILNQGDGSVSRIDPATNRVSASIPVGVEGPGGDIAVGAGRVWVRAKKVLLSAIDPKTNQVIERYGPPAGSGGVRVADGHVWITAHDTQTVWVLKP